MKLIFRNRVIRVYADTNAVMKALKETTCNAAPNYLRNHFSEASFRYSMRVALTADGIFAPILISGTIDAQGGFCIIRYRMRPVTTFFIAPVLFTVLCVYDFIRKSPHVIMWLFFAFILIIWSIPFLHFSWRETACEERILRKLNEIDKYHDVSFS